MIKKKPTLGNYLSFNDNNPASLMKLEKILSDESQRVNTIGDENLENANDDLNCIPAINLKMYGTLISNQPPTKNLREIDQITEDNNNVIAL